MQFAPAVAAASIVEGPKPPSTCIPSAPKVSMRSASDARLAKSDESIDGAIFASIIIPSSDEVL
ncbi:hypothetical protein Hanom_Chr09g00819651 [Helianthus anomalus]